MFALSNSSSENSLMGNQVAQQNPDRNSRKDQKFVAVPSANETTAQQLSMLVNVAHGLIPFVARGHEGFQPGASSDAAPAIDGGVVTAAAVTINNALSKIDAILADDKRWTDHGTAEQTKVIHETVMEQREVVARQLDLTRQLQRPWRLLEAKVGQLPGGPWCAMAVPAPGAVPLVGIGDSPKAALDDFDAKFIERVVAEAAAGSAQTPSDSDQPPPPAAVVISPEKKAARPKNPRGKNRKKS